jgi:tyrosine-specific transport protein
VVITAFGFHIVIPTLVRYLDRDVKSLKICLIVGSLVPLLVYLVWQTVMFGTVPLFGSISLAESFRTGTSVTIPLAKVLVQTPIALPARLLHAFAIVTSFLGVTLSLSDFLKDGLKLDRSHSSRILATALTFVPPLLFVWTFPRVFAVALEYASIFVAILLGLLPVAMVWSRRYKQKIQSNLRAPVGRVLMLVAVLAFTLIIALQVMDVLGCFTHLNQKYLGSGL